MEIGQVERAFVELVAEKRGEERAWREQARVVFLTVVLPGLRRGEILGLRWRHVSLADPAGALLRVAEGAPARQPARRCVLSYERGPTRGQRARTLGVFNRRQAGLG